MVAELTIDVDLFVDDHLPPLAVIHFFRLMAGRSLWRSAGQCLEASIPLTPAPLSTITHCSLGPSWSELGHFLAAFLMALSWQGIAAISLGLLESAASRSFSEEMIPRCKGLRGESSEVPADEAFFFLLTRPHHWVNEAMASLDNGWSTTPAPGIDFSTLVVD